MRYLFVVAVVVGCSSFAIADDEVKLTGDNLSGELLDIGCYVDQQTQGKDSASAAKACHTCGKPCVDGGPIGLLVGDTVYLLTGGPRMKNETLAGFLKMFGEGHGSNSHAVTFSGKAVALGGGGHAFRATGFSSTPLPPSTGKPAR